MRMLYTDLKPGICIVMDGKPYLVMETEFLRMQQRKAVVKAKIKNLISGAIQEQSFQPSDEIEEAEVEKTKVKFLYHHRGEFWFSPLEISRPDTAAAVPKRQGGSLTGFSEIGNSKNRFKLGEEIIGRAKEFLKSDLEVIALKFSGEIFNIELPVKVDYKIIEAPPSIKGNTAQGGTKTAVIESGAKVTVPLFVNEGDVIRVNTNTGEYYERVEKG